MLHISDRKNIDCDNFLDLARNQGIYVNENLFLKKIEENNYGVFAREEINNNNKIISIPKKFLISQNLLKNFIQENKIDYPDLDFLKLYFSSFPDFEYLKKSHIALSSDEQKNKILNFFIEQSPTRRKIKSFFDHINQLDNLEKYLFLIFRSRGFILENIAYLAPVLDMVNYKFGEVRAQTDKKEIYFKNNETIKTNNQFFQGYESHSDIVSFFFTI